ncbi:MAG: DUF72 domain-containing protein [Myxococcales bacterium]|nr:DUF72 domain-containing protein [Myxococcales bacterium]
MAMCDGVLTIRALGRELFVDTTLGIERFYIDNRQVLRRGIFSLEETVSIASLRRRLSRLESVPSVRVCQVLAAALERTPLGRALLEREMELTTDGTLWVAWRNLVAAARGGHDGAVRQTDAAQSRDSHMPAHVAVADRSLAVARFHGRREAVWDKAVSVQEKYAYLYSPEELAPWSNAVATLSGEAESVHVVFNNCNSNYAVLGAKDLTAELVDAFR